MKLLHWPVTVRLHFEWPEFLQRILRRAIKPVSVDVVRLRHLIDSEDGEPDSLIAVLEFNNDSTDRNDLEIVDLSELESSLAKDGTFFIWTCSCGAPGCAGLFDGVHVKHEGENTIWHDRDSERMFVFKSTDLQDAYQRGIIDGQCQMQDRLDLQPVPEQNATAYQLGGSDGRGPRG